MILRSLWLLLVTLCLAAPWRPLAPLKGQEPDPDAGPSPIRARVVGPGTISTGGGYELALSLSPDGSEAWFTRCGPSFERDCVIFVARVTEEGWAEPRIAPFSGRWEDLDPFVSPDGERIYFMSDRPLQPDGARKDHDLWFVRREGAGWSRPSPVGPPVNTPALEGFPAVTADGTLYFFSNRPGGHGRSDIYRTRPREDGWEEPENLGPAINSPESDTNAYPAPDGSYLVFASRRDGGRGGFDLWYSEQREGGWSDPIELGPRVNSERWEFTPSVSPDGATLFFASPRFARPQAPPDAPIDAAAHAARIGGVGNGLADVYVVDLRAVLAARIDRGTR